MNNAFITQATVCCKFFPVYLQKNLIFVNEKKNSQLQGFTYLVDLTLCLATLLNITIIIIILIAIIM